LAEKKKEGLLFRWFNPNRDNRADALEEDTRPTFKRYFKLLGRKFWNLISLNVMMLPMIFPILLMAYLYIGIEKTPTENTPLFSVLYGANLIESSPSSTVLLDLFGGQVGVPIYNNTATYIGIGICALFLLVTFGWQNVGSTYILRSMVRGEPVFLFSDYFYAVRRNLKQGLLMGILDAVAIFLLAFDMIYFGGAPTSYLMNVGYYAIFALILLYFFMRFYIYLMLVTFDLPIRKILKNALIFTVLGWKRNLMGLIGILVITSINVVLFPIFAITPLGIAIPLILPFLYYLSVTSFTSAYAAYPIIERYMIEPYSTPTADETEEDAPQSEESTEA
jgi:uncharacterized membrane protein YesL